MTESEQGIFNAILRAHVDFTSDPWPSLSPAAKDLVRKMLHSDPKQRLTAFQVLSKYIYFEYLGYLSFFSFFGRMAEVLTSYIYIYVKSQTYLQAKGKVS
jgi:serine/threonine protein kinase